MVAAIYPIRLIWYRASILRQLNYAMAESLETFLTDIPPGKRVDVQLLLQRDANPDFPAPAIRLHCPSEHCGSIRFFAAPYKPELMNHATNTVWNIFVTYRCRDCGTSLKLFAMNIQKRVANGETLHSIVKLGEDPPFGPPIPSKAMALVGPDRDAFLKGRRCETQGLGVGAYAYYRRVIENQKNRIFSEFIRVLKAVSPNDPVIMDLERAKEETQFSKSMDTIKHALPSSLAINGQNPIGLLHSALSEGIHALDDETCLAYAAAIRTVLFEVADRLSTALRDDAELAKAVTLLNRAGRGATAARQPSSEE